MNSPALITFRHPWRSYQERVLNQLDRYRTDGRVHIVAPPGAGKTVLGLEIVRRSGNTALVLVPSLTIRAQWATRYREDFGADPATISHDLTQPRPLTIVTYQALYEYHKRNETAGLDWLELLVVDECHHLRNEWWRVLDGVVQTHRPELLALTATPPYDVSGAEWRRYHDFCGEIDEEISVPELVASGDLCPHQDYLYPVAPPPGEASAAATWRARKNALLGELRERSGLAYYLQEHPWLAAPEDHYTAIFEEPEYFTALLSVLRAQGSEPPAAALGVLHGEVTLAPKLDDHWAAVFLQRALRTDPYFATDEGRVLLRPYRKQLTALGAWQQGKLRLAEDLPPDADEPVTRAAAAGAKLAALTEIARAESEHLGAGLRMVILTDHIYAELLPTTEHDRTPLPRVGTVPVFETLRRQTGTLYEGDLCLLSGSLVILPARVESRLLELAYDELPMERVIRTRPLFSGPPPAPANEDEQRFDYIIVNTGGLANKYTVGWATQLFTEGAIRIIVGTKSLLGEGWDAPVINSLVLANTVGSFVLSNQMRGRAIRTVPGNPGKTANIWHPVVVHPGSRGGGPDVRRMRRRFRAFAGPRLDGKIAIQNGLDRFGVDWKTPDLGELRNRMIGAATERNDLTQRWTAALNGGTQLVEAIRPPAERYFEKKDPLTRHYRESIDRYFEQDYRFLLLEVKRATVLASLLGTVVAVFVPALGWWWLTLLPLVLGAGSYALRRFHGMHARARQLRLRERQPAIYGRDLHLGPTIVWPALLSLPLLIIPFAFLAYWVAFTGWMSWHFYRNPGHAAADATRRFELLADNRNRLQVYGRALAESLRAAEAFQKATPEQLLLEEEGEEMFLYLSDADHHDTQQFAAALSELMSPVENPRYLLQLELPDDWTAGEYYLAVPAVLGNRKAADDLALRLSEGVGQRFRAVYTRDPAGRLHLLTARLQATNQADAAASRDLLWR